MNKRLALGTTSPSNGVSLLENQRKTLTKVSRKSKKRKTRNKEKSILIFEYDAMRKMKKS